ncbi:MAG: DUF4838 domain-containing protein, partial [Planctomycetes bacterium]|nr:DUF4838 domain-containing protein [Planctomycetota bacterium]
MRRDEFPCVVGVLLVLASSEFAHLAFGEAFIVKDGRPQAEILLAEPPLRATKLAAAELQANVLKMTGVTLPIASQPSRDVPVRIYVGRSPHTDRLNITDDGLKHGAFRMASGESWLALVGHDGNFEFRGPYLRGAGDMPRVLEEWDKASGAKWAYPFTQVWKQHSKDLDIWEQDERGSLNAVYRFLYDQGMRWYLPHELGEIVPKKATIALPKVNVTVRPDFALRYPYQYAKRFGGGGRDEVLWQLRSGFNQAPDLIGVGYIAHGTAEVLARDEMKKAHPDYYALFSGQRANAEKFVPCLSSEGLLQENVRFVRAMFDIFDAPMVSVMPTDGFTAICQCDLCKDKGTPERGWQGQFSDYAWDYVNRVAQEALKTHPQKKIVGMAYTTYLLPPMKIAKFSPNVVVCMAQNRGDLSKNPEMRKVYTDAQKAYLEKLPQGAKQFCIYDYYRYAVPGKPYQFMPVFFPHAIAQDLRHLKGFSFGDYIEVYREAGLATVGVTHLNLYVTARLWWDADQDVDALLEEYYTLFYGPARDEMKTFIGYCEANWGDLRQSAEKIGQTFDLLRKAQQKVEPDSVHAKRIALIADYIQPIKALQEQLSKGRENVPKLRARTLDRKDIRMDGQLDDPFWQGVPGYGSGQFKQLLTGEPPANKTFIKVAWADDSLYFGIKCMDRDMKNLNIGATKNDDSSVWRGDCVEILLETQTHSYYQIAISPSGAMVDADRKRGINTLWSSG